MPPRPGRDVGGPIPPLPMRPLVSSLLLALALAVTGCADGALTDAPATATAAPTADAFGGGGFCNPPTRFHLLGPSSLSPGQTATYGHDFVAYSGCTIDNVIWTAGPGTVVSYGNEQAQIKAPASGASSMEVTVAIWYDNNGYHGYTTQSKTVSVR